MRGAVVRVPVRAGGEARILDEVGAPDGPGEPGPALVLGDDDELEPAPVGGAVEVVQGARRVLAPRAPRELRPAQHRLRVQGVPPQPVRHQGWWRRNRPVRCVRAGRGRWRWPRTGLIAVGWSPIPGSDFAGGESGAGRTMSISPLRAQSAVLSKPVLNRSGAALAVRGEGGVDQPLVVRGEMLVADPEPVPRGKGEVGDEDVRGPDETVEGSSPGLGS